tara:strand:- start:10871 stop:12676 length:1806 start_codon:yes stop_codon:yes gene_type:complete
VKIGLLKQYRSTVYSLAVILACLTVGCLRQPGEVISQSGKNAESPLIASNNSSTFNFFESKKKSIPDQAVAKHKVDASSPRVDPLGFEADPPARISIVGNLVSRPVNSAEQIQKNARKIVDQRAENWRSKSLVDLAKKYPSNKAESSPRDSGYIQQASSSKTQDNSGGKDQTSQIVSTASDEYQTENKTPEPESAAINQYQADEVSRHDDPSAQQGVASQTAPSGNDLPQDLKRENPVLGEVNQEMRRFQINSIMKRAKREAEQKNYEYAAFLAEQALESSYRGHIAFSPEEESPQMLLRKIKSVMSPLEDSDVKPVEHTKPDVQTTGGQSVQNFQFTPSSVHPLKRRPAEKPKEIRPQPRPSTGANDELPMIVPRNMGTEQQAIPRRNYEAPQQRERAPGISLDTPSFEQQPEEPTEFPVPEKTHPSQSSTVPQRGLKLELEEVPNEPPAKIRLSGPEPVQQGQVNETEKSASPGPQLMLPSLPSKSKDLTSQADPHHSGWRQGAATSPVKFRSKIQENRQNDSETGADQKFAGADGNRPRVASTLTLDEIEWDLDEKRRPQLGGAWWGMSTLLLIIGGAIILLLLTIIVILLKRGNPAS